MNANRAIIVRDCTNNSGIFSTQQRGINGVIRASSQSLYIVNGGSRSVTGQKLLVVLYHCRCNRITKKPQPRMLSGYLAQTKNKILTMTGASNTSLHFFLPSALDHSASVWHEHD